MPKELQEYISELPPVSENNSRDIVRNTWNRIQHLHPYTQAQIMEKYGVYLDPDWTPGRDDGEAPYQHNEE